MRRGMACHNAKLTDDDVRRIRELREYREKLLSEAKNLTDAKIAEKFEVHANVVWKIGNGAAWVHVR